MDVSIACRVGGYRPNRTTKRGLSAACCAPRADHFQTARQKQQALWRDICDTKYQRLPPWTPPWALPLGTASTLLRMARDPTFVREVVDAPYTNRSDVRPDREKLFHRLGVCATGEFTPCAGSSLPGVLGAPTPLVMRLSIATVPALFAPGMALKFFRDAELSSVNILAAPGLDPQPSGDFFAHPAHTIVDPPQTLVARAFFEFLGKRHDPYGMNLRQALALSEQAPRVPSKLTFMPLVRLPNVAAKNFREALAGMPVGAPLWQVWADGRPIGCVRQTSAFVASSFGDRRLHFAHD